MGKWVCLKCKNKNQDNMKFCPLCHSPRILTDPQYAQAAAEPQKSAQPMPFPYPTEPQSAPQMPFPYPMEPQPAEPQPDPAAALPPVPEQTPRSFVPEADLSGYDPGRRLRIILIAANAACLVLNIVGIIVLLK